MSTNKNKYWLVETSKVVYAANKADALVVAASTRARPTVGKILAQDTVAERIMASDAHQLVASVN